MWTLTVPKLLRPYFFHHRELLGKLCQVAWATVGQLMDEATGEEDGFRTGMVAVVQSAGDLLEPNPHVHAIVADLHEVLPELIAAVREAREG